MLLWFPSSFCINTWILKKLRKKKQTLVLDGCGWSGEIVWLHQWYISVVYLREQKRWRKKWRKDFVRSEVKEDHVDEAISGHDSGDDGK